MTNQTASLVFLFVASVMLSGPLLGGLVRWSEDTALSIWLAPTIAVASLVLMLVLGRRYVLPQSLSTSFWRSVFVTAAIVSLTMALALGAVWAASRAIGGAAPGALAVLGVWFVGLWGAITALNRREFSPRRM